MKKFAIAILSIFLVCLTATALTACNKESIKPVAKLTIVQPPIKTSYIQGERFDPAGLIVNAEFEDGTTEENVNFGILPDRPLQPTDTMVAVTYGDKKVGIDIKVLRRGNQEQYSVANTPSDPTSPLKGKTYLFLGSSVTLGSGSGQESMADFIAKRNDCVSIKKAVSGTTLADINNNSYVKRLETYIESNDRAPTLDAFICQLSTNDANNPESFGTITADNVKDASSFEKTTTFGAIEYIIARVKETWNCPVIFYTNSYYKNEGYADMVEALHKISAKWNIAVIDLYSDTAFNNISESDYELYMTDEIHPTKAGYREWWLPKFEETLKSL